MLDYFDELARRGNAYRRVTPNVNSYNMVINAYAKSQQEDAARKAEAILYRLINQKGRRIRPNSRSFGVVISIWARSKERGAADRAEQLLHQMEKLYVEGIREAEPNVIVYSTVVSFELYVWSKRWLHSLILTSFLSLLQIDAWAKSKHPDAARKAQRILDGMQTRAGGTKVHPNTICFNALLNAWANSNKPEAASRALSLLQQMNDLHDAGFRDVRPNSRTMNYAMLCVAKNSQRDAQSAEQAEMLLDRMLDLFISGNEKMMPDSFSFSTAVNAWAWSRSPDAGKGVIRTVEKMEDLFFSGVVSSKPHAISYNQAIAFFVERGDAQHADDMLVMMENTYKKGVRDAMPDSRTYAAVLKSCAQVPAGKGAKRALHVLARMQCMYDGGNKAAKPNTVCYNTVLSAVARSSHQRAALQAQQLLKKMKDLHASDDLSTKPDTISYSTVVSVMSLFLYAEIVLSTHTQFCTILRSMPLHEVERKMPLTRPLICFLKW